MEPQPQVKDLFAGLRQKHGLGGQGEHPARKASRKRITPSMQEQMTRMRADNNMSWRDIALALGLVPYQVYNFLTTEAGKALQAKADELRQAAIAAGAHSKEAMSEEACICVLSAIAGNDKEAGVVRIAAIKVLNDLCFKRRSKEADGDNIYRLVMETTCASADTKPAPAKPACGIPAEPLPPDVPKAPPAVPVASQEHLQNELAGHVDLQVQPVQMDVDGKDGKDVLTFKFDIDENAPKDVPGQADPE